MLGLSKLLVGSAVVLVPAGVIAGTTLFSAPPKSTPLSKLALDSFTREKGYEKCLTFLSADNKESLLFACFEKIQEQEENKPFYYFYDGYGWNKAIQLTKQGLSNKVSITSNGWKLGEVYDSKNELKGLNESFPLDNCEYYKQGTTNKLSCYDGDPFEDEETMPSNLFFDDCEEFGLFNDESEESFNDISGLAQIELKEFQEESSSKSQ